MKIVISYILSLIVTFISLIIAPEPVLAFGVWMLSFCLVYPLISWLASEEVSHEV